MTISIGGAQDLRNLANAVTAACSRARAILVDHGQMLTEQHHEGVLQESPPMDTLEVRLEAAYETVLLALDAGGMLASRARMVDQFNAVNFRDMRYDADYDVVWSPALNKLQEWEYRLMDLVDPDERETSNGLERLETTLRSTAALLQRRGVHAAKEGDVQRVMNDYLGVVFPNDYVTNVKVPGLIKNFQPDCGVLSLRAAIEFKFADDINGVKTALSGVVEDVSGYSGSADWTRFYAVVFQTAAFSTEAAFMADFQRMEVTNWTPILQTGRGGRKKK